MSFMKRLNILLIGQPNVGKSSLLNALVGPRVVVSNYPGTTVELMWAEKSFGDVKIDLIDTPGIYSISDRSEEEKVTKKALFEEKVDGAIVVADAVSLERSLYIVLQILEAGVSTVLALNFVEDAKKRGIKIDYEKLEKLLNIPVVPINPITRRGMNKLVETVLRIKKIRRSFKIRYDDHIEKAIEEISTEVRGKLPKRFVALRVLEGDEDFYRYLKDEGVIKKARKSLRDHPEVAKDISITRYGTASFIAEKVTQIILLRKKEELQEKIDNILLHKIWGPFMTGLSFLIIFGILLYLGKLMQGILTFLAESFLSSFVTEGYSIMTLILIQTLTGLTAGISIALPYVFLFYLLLGLLEDIGLLSRFIVNSERFLKKLGLSGKSFIPLALGLGCTVPAIRATRILSSKKEQFYTSSFLAFVPCSSRIAIIMGIVGFYGDVKLVLSVFITLLIAGLIWAFLIKKIIHTRGEFLLLELPPYRRPLIKNILVKSWIRMRSFIYVVIPLLVLGGVIYGSLEALGFVNYIIEPLSPLTTWWLELPAVTAIPLIFGFLQKDLTGAMLISVLNNKISLFLTPLQIYTFGVASTAGVPCIIALGMLVKDFGFRKAITLTISSIAYSFLISGLIWRVISIF